MTENEERLTGTVAEFHTQRGFGHLERDGDGPESEKRVFVHWKEIKTDARWPTLNQGDKVEYTLGREKGKGIRAVNVTAVGGEKLDCTLPFLGEEISGGPFKGKVRFYHLKKGFGFIEPDGDIPGVEWGDDEKNKRFHVNRCDIVSDDEPPALKPGESVEFKVYKNDKGYSAREVTGPDGAKIHHERSDFNTGGGWGAKRGRPDGWGGRGGWGGGPKRARHPPIPLRPRNGGDGGNGQIEVGLAVKKYHVGGIIGTKGANIRSITKESGANLQFGQQDIYCMGEPHCVLAISGVEEDVKKACKIVATKLGECAQSIDHKVIFLVPEDYCGMLIGKKGATIKRITEASTTENENEKRCRVDVSNDPIQLPGATPANTCSLYGGQECVAKAIDEIVVVLGQISNRVQQDQAAYRPPPQFSSWGPPKRGRGNWNSGGRRRW